MKLKQTSFSKYLNFTKKNKSKKKSKLKNISNFFIDSSNKYSNVIQSSLREEDMFLLKRKLKGSNKGHSHSSTNANKNIEQNKSNKMPVSTYMSYLSPGNNHLLKKKKKEKPLKDKSLKHHLMLTSMNNSSIINSSKDKILSYMNNISNYQSNKSSKHNNIINPNLKKKTSFKNSITNITNITNANNSCQMIGPNDYESFNPKKFSNSQIELNNTKKSNKDKKYSLTTMNSRKNSVEKEEPEIVKKLKKINFNGIFKNYNLINKKIISTSKNSTKNIEFEKKNGKKIVLNDFFNLKKSGKQINNFFEIYLKEHQSNNNNNKKLKKNINSSNQNHHKSMSNFKNNANSTTTNTITPNNNINNNFSPTNYSPVSSNKFYKTAKVSPRASFPKKKQEIQSHRISFKNKISGNILAFYNDNKKHSMNNDNKYLLYGNSYNLDNNSNYINNKTNSQIIKKSKKNISVNMNITANNNNFNLSNLKSSNLVSNSNFAKCSSLNKIKHNYITNYNNFYNNNNSFINKKIINPIMNNTKKHNNENQNSNIINNCQININNINYNNYNQNVTQKSNQLFNEKIMKLLKKKNLVEVSNLKGKKIISQSQQEIKTKKIYKKNYTTNNSPNNKNNPKSKTKHLKNSSNNNPKQKSKIKTRDTNIPNCINNASNKKSNKKPLKKENIEEYFDISSIEKRYNSKNEIIALKKNLQKNNSENILKNKIIETKDKEKNNRTNTISCTSSKTKDANYYMEKCKSLSNYIKKYYQENKKYPSTNLNFYLYGRLIGQGAFGKVNIGLNILAGRVVAIKSFNKKELDKNGENMKKILYETDLMKKLNHPNITKILEVFEDEDYILISMEYINGGNLFSFVKKRRKLSEKTAKYLFRQIILGIQHIHSHKIVHRDIKLENILIDLNNNIKICDFGIGKILSYNRQLLYDKCGTPMYMAPEILLSSKNHGYEGYPVDIWSAGISLYIMLSGSLPFNLKNNESSSMDESSENNIELQYSIINNEPKYIEKISDEARDLLNGLLNKNPNKRLTIDQILNHPWLQMDERKGKNKKYHLFTKAEIIMLSKTYIDYRNGVLDDLKENFTLSNLKKDKEAKMDKNKIKNISTKSSLLAPYNTLIQDDDSEMDYDLEDSLEDINNPNIILENDIILIKNKVKEFNLNYELNNNGECDNGMLINTKTGTLSSSMNNSSKIDGKITSRSRQRNEEENILSELNEDLDEQGEAQEKKIEKILEEIEKLGFDKEYVLNCVNKNILCYASSVFYLMLNYKNI